MEARGRGCETTSTDRVAVAVAGPDPRCASVPRHARRAPLHAAVSMTRTFPDFCSSEPPGALSIHLCIVPRHRQICAHLHARATPSTGATQRTTKRAAFLLIVLRRMKRTHLNSANLMLGATSTTLPHAPPDQHHRLLKQRRPSPWAADCIR